MAKKLLSTSCPSCGLPMQTAAMACATCGVKIEGNFNETLFDRLNSQDQKFLEQYLLAGFSIKTLEQNRYAPVRLLDTMTKMVVAKRMWFTRLEDKGKSVKIDGIALDNKTVADFMVRLQGCGLFKNVNLKTLRRQEVQANNLKYFQVICEKVPDQKPAQKTTEKKAKT